MKRAALILALLLALALAGGCTKSALQTVALGPDGEPIIGADGKIVILTHEVTDEVANYQAQESLAKANTQPVFELRVPSGQTLSLPGGTELIVRGGNGGGHQLRQYRPWYADWGGMIVTAALGAWNAEKSKEVAVAGFNALANSAGPRINVGGNYTTGGTNTQLDGGSTYVGRDGSWNSHNTTTTATTTNPEPTASE
ncbi:hypothetical protein AAU61_15010 [Desulfocarbo indianensis]|nr:hypothetical protein AAU61_15010 [Desulfocarbo indianensis]